jgi:uncharacterized membrane protein
MAWPPSSGCPAVGAQRRCSRAAATGPCGKTADRYSATANDSSVATPGDVTGGEPAQDLQPSEEAIDGEIAGSDPSHLVGRVAWAGFRGPLPPPDVLAAYNQVEPGLAREIVNQWTAETEHRRRTIDGLREIDHESMRSYYKGERDGQRIALVAFLAVVVLAIVVAVVLRSEAVAIAAIITGGASAIWALRRRSDGPAATSDLANGDALEKTEQGSDSGDH